MYQMNNIPVFEQTQQIPALQRQFMPSATSYTPQMQHCNRQQQLHYSALLQLPQTSQTTTNPMLVTQMPQYNLQYPPLSQQETEWQLVAGTKKRNRIDSPEKVYRQTKQSKLADYWLNSPVPTTNKFSTLSEGVINEDSPEQQDTAQESNQKISKPPPIFVDGVKQIKPLTDLLKTLTQNEYEIKTLANDQVKISLNTSEKYTQVIKALAEKKTEFHTYQLKENRPFRTVLRNLHQTTDINEIKQELLSQGHTVTNISNIRQRNTKKPIPLFFIDLKPSENNKDIYKIEFLLNTKVKFEPPHQKREIPQCTRCQRYGHTKKYCHHTARCVKCTEDHLTTECTRKDRNNQVRCVLCNGNHPANYRGCTILHKELQKSTYPGLRKKSTDTANPLKPISTSQKHVMPDVPYSQAVAGHSLHFQPTTTPTTVPQPTASYQQTSDMQELKQMLKGLMEQMGTMLNLLTALVAKKP